MRFLPGLLAFALVIQVAPPAAAHLTLHSPVSRYGGNVLKVGPCGAAGGERSDNVTVLPPGASIDVVWDEYVDHPGHFRIAFDIDGDDDFVDPACLADCNTRTPQIELYSNDTVLLDGIADTPSGGRSGATVELPDVECDRCTLQVIQVMYDKPPYVTPGNDIYYQCADLILRRAAPPSPTPTCAPEDIASCAGPCPGDCDGSGDIDVSELVRIVNIGLGTAGTSACPTADTDGDGVIQIGEVVEAVRRGLTGCHEESPRV